MLGKGMNAPENNLPERKYKWPWFVLAAVALGAVLAVLVVASAAKKVEQQRDFTPLPDTAPVR